MKSTVIIGSGISGMTCAIICAAQGIHVTLVSPYPAERAQSVMAAGGINAVTADHEGEDSIEQHIEDTLKGGCYLGGEQAVRGLCEHAGRAIRFLETIGTVFTLEKDGRLAIRAFGGQSHDRTHFCGASTGKQIVSALTMEVRRYEEAGLIRRMLRFSFHSALIREGCCYGALVADIVTGELKTVCADALVIASGGQNALFGKTTGSTQCDGYAAGRLFIQGAELKNLEFIQYHPTTLETSQKRMLITEAVRGEGGRLYYTEDGRRVYFMEEKYGEKGNLMTRDVVSREINDTGKEVFLDISFLDKNVIDRRIPEVRDLCAKYRGIDISKDPIPVAPSVHFFMGGIAVHLNHETNIKNLFAIGECASMYHGANRLGGNSLLAAVHSGLVAAETIAGRTGSDARYDFSDEYLREKKRLIKHLETESTFPVQYIRDMLAETMHQDLGIVRSDENLAKGLKDVDYYLSAAEKLRYDSSVSPYVNYSLTGILTLAKAVLLCARFRTESRGAHYRSDYPETSEAFAHTTIISYDDGQFSIRLDKEHTYES